MECAFEHSFHREGDKSWAVRIGLNEKTHLFCWQIDGLTYSPSIVWTTIIIHDLENALTIAMTNRRLEWESDRVRNKQMNMVSTSECCCVVIYFVNWHVHPFERYRLVHSHKCTSILIRQTSRDYRIHRHHNDKIISDSLSLTLYTYINRYEHILSMCAFTVCLDSIVIVLNSEFYRNNDSDRAIYI